MKPIYWVLIAIGVALIVFFAYKSYDNKKKAEQAAILAAQNQTIQSPSSTNYSSTLAQVINSLFPFFDTYYSSKKTGA